MPIEVKDKREISPEGFLTADAVLTKVGDLNYTRGELGLDGNPSDIVKLRRSRDVLEKALPSMRGAFVTVGHPGEFIGADDAKSQVVGSVITEPVIDNNGFVKAKVRIFDKDAINRIESGVDELSPGFNFVPKNMTGDSGDITQMSINHVAIVPRGRAGHTVRLLDSLPPGLSGINEDLNMKPEEIQNAITKAIDQALNKDTGKGVDKDAVVKGVVDAINPVIEGIKELKDAQAKAESEAAKKKAEDEAEKERTELIEKIVKDERARYQIIQDAAPFIAEDERDGLLEMDAKDVLVKAVGDSVKNAKDMSTERLQGILEGRALANAQYTHEVKDANYQGIVDKSFMKKKNSMTDLYKAKYKKARGMKEEEVK